MADTAKRRCLIACLAVAGWAALSLLISSTLPGQWAPSLYLVVAAAVMFAATRRTGRWIDAAPRPVEADTAVDRTDAIYLIDYADRHVGCRRVDPHGAHRFSWRAYVDLPHAETKIVTGSKWCGGWPR